VSVCVQVSRLDGDRVLIQVDDEWHLVLSSRSAREVALTILDVSESPAYGPAYSSTTVDDATTDPA
jgi:hypothetical protein